MYKLSYLADAWVAYRMNTTTAIDMPSTALKEILNLFLFFSLDFAPLYLHASHPVLDTHETVSNGLDTMPSLFDIMPGVYNATLDHLDTTTYKCNTALNILNMASLLEPDPNLDWVSHPPDLTNQDFISYLTEAWSVYYVDNLLRIMVFVLLNFYFITMVLDSSHDLLSCDS